MALKTNTAVLLCNLGTPDEPTAPAVRRYLAQFLADPRVVEIPRVIWLPILYAAILPFRPAKSAAKYASIWTPEGSPLRLWTERQSILLQGWLGEQGHAVTVRFAMRYGAPSIASQLSALAREGITRVIILPSYPQYSGTTTASIIDAVSDWTRSTRSIPEIRYVNEYHAERGYIDALAAGIERYWSEHGRAEHFVMSFHGIPERAIKLGDPYQAQCLETARRLAARLALAEGEFSVTFQSRFGNARWLEPYTEPSLIALARRGVKRVDVACPGFTCDCLETLEEIAQEARDAFLGAGGDEFHYIPCLNDDASWIGALGTIAARHMGGWPTLRAEAPSP
jgi:ferrochelatase